MNDDELLRYSRHILLPEIDIDGQQRIVDGRILIAGCGGLGCAAALYLAASGVGQLALADFDTVELSNLQRQIGHHTQDIGRRKVDSLADKLRAINPAIAITCIGAALDDSNLPALLAEVDIVLDCSDNFATRHLLNQHSRAAAVPLVSGAAIRFDGQVAVFNRSTNSACYACLYGDDNRNDSNTCSNNGVLSPLVGIIGATQAAEALKLLSGAGEPLDNQLLVLDARVMEWRKLRLARDPACPVCQINQH